MRISEKRMSEIAYWIWFGRYPVDDGPEVGIIRRERRLAWDEENRLEGIGASFPPDPEPEYENCS